MPTHIDALQGTLQGTLFAYRQNLSGTYCNLDHSTEESTVITSYVKIN
jgi:hypothetical protein